MTDYKSAYRKQLEDAQARMAGSTEVFFDASKSLQDRLEAFKNFGTFNEEEHIRKGMEILHDDTQPEDLRAAILEGLINEVSRNEKLMDEVIVILRDASAPVKLRRAALTVLQASSFSSSIFPVKRPAYLNALRDLIDSADPILKQSAMEHLAMNNDSYIQSRLVEGLKEPDKEITPPEVAIQLLSYDLHAEHFPILREIAENPPNVRSKKEALRNLAADPDSRDLLLQNLQDPTVDPETRHVCAVALETVLPGDAQPYAKAIILDENEDEELKTAMLNTLTYSVETNALNDSEFKHKLENAKQQIASPNFKAVYSQYKSAAEQIKKNK
ncbi:hypothetical protein [Rufibacter tibetensis]|uniref:HEAT repeat domain-containing protein n=1 Tax=Rufibacter tibetensis TaxID=512763 RepID=A0A0P0CTV7_9BACT|nr:hypothetical protein [Rufibacter tibetensis]ALI97725.1 hypothetical protein DC20_00360 [Rufibacter tibetensis]